jgi:hypothetical protein
MIAEDIYLLAVMLEPRKDQLPDLRRVIGRANRYRCHFNELAEVGRRKCRDKHLLAEQTN